MLDKGPKSRELKSDKGTEFEIHPVARKGLREQHRNCRQTIATFRSMVARRNADEPRSIDWRQESPQAVAAYNRLGYAAMQEHAPSELKDYKDLRFQVHYEN